jgi:acyl-coenzyme A thioesterase PaaI-like protein
MMEAPRAIGLSASELPDLTAWLRVDGPPARLVAAGDGRARAELRIGSAHPPVPADSGAVLALGQAAAIAAGASALEPVAGARAVPRTIQMTLDLFQPSCAGTLTAEAEVGFRTGTSLIVDVKVRDERRKLVAALAVTQLAPEPRAGARLRLADRPADGRAGAP